MKPDVSVILPVHNGGAYLGEAVDSILNQSRRNLELLLIDDHSDDAAITDLAVQDPRLKVLESPGRGVAQAFNHGLRHATGHFIARMDADDIALRNRLELQLQYLEDHPEIDICGGCVEIFAQQALAGWRQPALPAVAERL